ncbi:MAG: serine hydrolase [Lachnospiraceae bacterium]|nr:serine hydrolase [Lachnospiraceae bacterium]
MDAGPWFVDDKDCDKITVRDLLHHTSGITTYQTFGELEITDSYGKYVYSNANYGLLLETDNKRNFCTSSPFRGTPARLLQRLGSRLTETSAKSVTPC